MPQAIPPPPVTFRSLVIPGLTAIRKYWRPFLFLQGSALAMVAAYYTSASVRAFCEHLSSIKNHGGLLFSAIAAAFAGAVLPELAKVVAMGDREVTRRRFCNAGFALSIYALNGILTDLQYRGIAWLLGSDTRFITALRKMLFDQLVTTPLYGTPYWIIAYLIRAERYDLVAAFRQISPGWYVARILPLLIPCWCFWAPMVLLIYSLPGSLQFFLFCFASAAWSLVMIFIASHEATATVSTPAA